MGWSVRAYKEGIAGLLGEIRRELREGHLERMGFRFEGRKVLGGKILELDVVLGELVVLLGGRIDFLGEVCVLDRQLLEQLRGKHMGCYVGGAWASGFNHRGE